MVNVGHQSNGREGEPSHNISLQTVAGLNETGFITINEQDGQHIPDVQVRPFQAQATQFTQGRGKHSDKKKPYIDIQLSDFIGGMGMLHHDEDASRYLDGYMVNTSLENRVMNQGLPRYTKGLREFTEHFPDAGDECSWKSLYSGGTETITFTFTTGSSAWTPKRMWFYLRTIGAPQGGTAFLDISIQDAGEVEQGHGHVNFTTLPTHSPYWEKFWFASGCDELAASTTYTVVISYSSGLAYTDEDNCVQVWYDDTNSKPVHRIYDDTTDFQFKMLEYKGVLYGVTIPDDDAVSKLYILGYRDVAADNSADLQYLQCSSPGWTADEFIGFPVVLLENEVDGKIEERPWRRIDDNDTSSLTCYPDWTVAHDGTVEFWIITDTWTLVDTLDGKIVDAVATDDYIIFSFGYAGGTVNTELYWYRRDSDESYEVDGTEGLEQMWYQKHDPNFNHPSLLTGNLWSTRGRTHEIQKFSTVGRYESQNTNVGQEGFATYLGTLLDNKSKWVGTNYANVTQHMAFEGPYANVGASFASGKFMHHHFDTPIDISHADEILLRFRLYDSDNLYEDAGDFSFVIADGEGTELSTNLFEGTDQESDGIYYTQAIPISSISSTYPDMTNITDIYVEVNTDDGDFEFKFYGPIFLTGRMNYGVPQSSYSKPGYNSFINNIVGYAGGAGETDEKPWFLGNKGWFYIENDEVKKVPLGEMAEFEHRRSGEAACVNGPYLYSNIGERIQRYHAGQMDDIGPDRDYGLPWLRRGIPSSAASYPGAVFFSFDAPHSHVMYRRGHGWHEMFRHEDPEIDQTLSSYGDIREIHMLSREDRPDELYINVGADVVVQPFALNPEQEDNFEYCFHSHIQTSRIYATTRETAKFFKAIELVQELHEDADTTPLTTFRVYYKTNAIDDWTLIGNFLDGSAEDSEEKNISSTHNVGGNWIQFLIEFETQDIEYSPILVAAVVDATERVVVLDTYTYNLKIREGYDDCLDESVDSVLGSTKVAQLKTWAKQELPLLLRSNSVFEDNKYVFIEPQRSRYVGGSQLVDGQEVRTFQLVLLEVA